MQCVQELKQELLARGLSVDGKKDELVARLEAALATEVNGDEDAAGEEDMGDEEDVGEEEAADEEAAALVAAAHEEGA